MRIPHIYCSELIQLNEKISLSKAKSHHLLRVLRLSENHPVTLFCGDGWTYNGRIAHIERDIIQLIATEKSALKTESPLSITLCQSLCRGEKMDWIVQKATELGVSKIIPVISEHTEVRIPPNKSDKKLAHWQSIAIAAAEQAKRQSVPRILTPLPLPDLIENRAIDPNAPLFVLSPDQGITLSSLALTPTACQCLIGPEGGFSDKEMAMFAQSSAHMVKMGPRVLRTETAALTAIGLCQGIWGDLK